MTFGTFIYRHITWKLYKKVQTQKHKLIYKIKLKAQKYGNITNF